MSGYGSYGGYGRAGPDTVYYSNVSSADNGPTQEDHWTYPVGYALIAIGLIMIWCTGAIRQMRDARDEAARKKNASVRCEIPMFVAEPRQLEQLDQTADEQKPALAPEA